MKTRNIAGVVTARLSLPLFGWLGGFMYVWNQPGMSFWDAFIWFYYIGRFIAHNFTLLHY